MKKAGIYAGIIILILLLNGCKEQENESKQGAIGTIVKESIVNISLEAGEENPFIVNVPEMSYEVEESEVSSNEVAEINESASVSDSKFTITVGTLLEDFYYDEEEIFFESSANNLVGTVNVGGRNHNVYFHAYMDISIQTTDYNLIINDMSGRNIYIKTIILWTPRFCTSKGITVGVTVDELKDVYGSENLELLDEDVPERTRYRYVDGNITMDFYIEQELITEIHLYY